MSKKWRYGIVRHADGNLSLCEIVYDDDRISVIVPQPLFSAYTAEGEDKNDIIKALRNALRDARTRPIIDESETR